MSMEFSAEDFINGGMGIKPNTSYTVKSSEGYDGFADGLSMELYRADQELQALEAFETLSDFNVSQKIKMIKRIANNYVGSIQNSVASNSIESVCLTQIRSLEDAAGAPAGDAQNVESPKTNDKKQGFLKTVFGAIARLLKLIWETIVKGITKFGSWIKGIFAKKNKNVEAPKTDEVSDLTNNNGAKATSGSTTSNDEKLDKQIDKSKMVFDLTTSFNPAGANKFIADYTSLSKAVDVVWKKYEKAVGSKTATADVNHAENKTFKNEDANLSAVFKLAGGVLSDFGLQNSMGIANGASVEDAKKYLNSASKNLRAAFNKADDVGDIVQKLFGFKKGTHEAFMKIVKSKSNADTNAKGAAVANLSNNANKLSSYYDAFVSKMETPHKTIVTITDNIQKKLDTRFDNNSNINETTRNMTVMQAMLKTCCTFEQSIGKIVLNINSNMMYQINLMK